MNISNVLTHLINKSDSQDVKKHPATPKQQNSLSVMKMLTLSKN